MSRLSDTELICDFIKHAGRSTASFNILVKRYEPLVFAFALKYLRNEEHAKDISQEVFIKAYSKISSLKDSSQFKGWILSITSNSCTNLYRKLKRQSEIQKQIQAELKSDRLSKQTDHNEKIDMVKECIETLKDIDREVIMLHYFSDESVKDIANLLGIGESAVKMRLSRSRDKVLKKMNLKSDPDNNSNV